MRNIWSREFIWEVKPQLANIPGLEKGGDGVEEKSSDLEMNTKQRLQRLEITPFLCCQQMPKTPGKVCVVPASPSRGSPSRGLGLPPAVTLCAEVAGVMNLGFNTGVESVAYQSFTKDNTLVIFSSVS